MLVYRIIATVLGAILGCWATFFDFVEHAWQFFEVYGWRLMIGAIAFSSFAQRLAEEAARRQLERSRLDAIRPERVAALDERRKDAMESFYENYRLLRSRRS